MIGGERARRHSKAAGGCGKSVGVRRNVRVMRATPCVTHANGTSECV